MHVNLFVKVGRAARHCVGTFPDQAAANAAKPVKLAELLASGNAPERVSFEVETVGGSKSKKGE